MQEYLSQEHSRRSNLLDLRNVSNGRKPGQHYRISASSCMEEIAIMRDLSSGSLVLSQL